MSNTGKKSRLSIVVLALAFLTAGLSDGGAVLTMVPSAFAQSAPGFPSRPIRMIVTSAPGALPDIVGRLVATKLSESLGQPVLVDNRTGAAGSIGMNIVAKSAPDGHTLGMLIISHAVNAALEGSALDVPKLPYSVTRDFTPISQLTSNFYVLVVNSKLLVRTLADLIALAKSRPGKLTYGSSGTGGVIHVAGEWLALAAKVKMTHVPYKSSALSINDLAGGHIDMTFVSIALFNNIVASGNGRGIAVTAANRTPLAPDLPTMIEAGIPSYEIDGWYGIVGPAGMPAPIVDRLSSEMARIVKFPEIRDKLASAGATGVGGTPGQFAALLQAEDRKWRRVVHEIGLAGK